MMSLLSYIKRSIKQRQMKKVHFNVIIRLEELTNVPYVNGVFYAKIRMTDSYRTSFTKHGCVKEHKIQWGSEHSLLCKTAIDPINNTLVNSFVKISIMKEVNGGKSFKTMGCVYINVAPFANTGSKPSHRMYILADGPLRQSNCLLQMSIRMCQTFGSTCFRVPNEDSSNCVNITQKISPDQCSSLSLVSPNKAEFSFVLTQDDHDEYDEDEDDRGCSGGVGGGCGDDLACADEKDDYSEHSVQHNEAHRHSEDNCKRQAGLMYQTESFSSDMAIYNTANYPEITLQVPNDNQAGNRGLTEHQSGFRMGHRRNISALETSDFLRYRNSGPNFTDDMSTNLLSKDRKCRSSSNFQDDDWKQARPSSVCHNNKLGMSNPPSMSLTTANHVTKQLLINSTRGSCIDIVDDVLNQVLSSSSTVHPLYSIHHSNNKRPSLR